MPNKPVSEINKEIAKLEARLNRSPAVKGAKVMRNIEDVPNPYFLRRPTGIPQLDIDTGGGLPAGGLVYISGPMGAGKSMLLYRYVAMQQKLYGDRAASAIGFSEGPPDHFYMRACGVQVAIPEDMIEERVLYRKQMGIPAFTKDELKSFRAKTVGTIKVMHGAHGDELMSAVLDCHESKIFDLVCLDSVSAILPEADAGKELDENQKRAAAAGLLTKFFQHYLCGTTGYLGTNLTTTIFTAQVRANAKKSELPGHLAKYAKDWASEGAWAAKHGKLLDITVWSGSKEKIESKETNPAAFGEEAEKYKKKLAVGKSVNYEITKGKAGVHEGVVGEYDYNYETGTDDYRMLLVCGMKKGVIKEKDGLITVHQHASGQPYEALTNIVGVDGFAKHLQENFEIELIVRREVLAAYGIQCMYR